MDNNKNYLLNTQEKINFWTIHGKNPYENKHGNIPHSNLEDHLLWKEKQKINTYGRILFKRNFGKITFLKLWNMGHTFQISLRAEINIQSMKYENIINNLDLGDIIRVEGIIYFSLTKEKTLEVGDIFLLSKNYYNLPDKYHGLKNDTLKLTQKPIQCVYDKDFFNRLKIRGEIISLLRLFLKKNKFLEVETPILNNIASGAAAQPFKTYHKSLDKDLYLRIAPELYLKQIISGGFNRIYEIGKNFRNEGMDTNHLQEFTMMECYATLWTWKDYIKFTTAFFKILRKKFHTGNNEWLLKINTQVINMDIWTKISFTKLIHKYTKININCKKAKENLTIYLKKKSPYLRALSIQSSTNLLDMLYKKFCRPHLINPTIVYDYPDYMMPLSHSTNGKAHVFQLVINGQEMIKSYTELVNPTVQLKNFQKQQVNSDEDHIPEDKDFLNAMRFGMCPMAGFGLGLDRLIALISQTYNIKDTIFFPLHNN